MDDTRYGEPNSKRIILYENTYNENGYLINMTALEERKKGKWMPHREICREYIGTVLVNVTYDYWFCDACGYRVEKGQPMYNFCPNCGADMRGEGNGNE